MGPDKKTYGGLALVPIVVALLLVGACGSSEEAAAPAETPPAAERPAEKQQKSTARLVTDKALVQILFSGLVVVDTRGIDADPGQLAVYLRKIPKHRALLSEGRRLLPGPTWVTLGNLAKVETIAFELDEGSLGTTVSGRKIAKYPTKANRRDSRWMLGVAQLEKAVEGFDGTSMTRVLLEAGTLETCGFVHSREGGVCRVKTGGRDGQSTVLRSMAEYMVVRHEVARDHPLKAHLDDETFELSPTELKDCSVATPDACVVWGDKLYSKVFDVAIRNFPDPQPAEGQRPMITPYPRRIAGLFDGATNDWRMSSPDCPEGVCECAGPETQPDCFGYFSQFGEVGAWKEGRMMSGTHRRIAPLVGYP